MAKSDLRTKLILCNCGSCEHQLILQYLDGDEIPEISCKLYLYDYHIGLSGLFYRISRAIKFIFGYKSQYGDWDCLSLSIEKAKEVIEFCQEFVNSVK